jgi:O-antigen/teichoic acid export membrane protein
LTGTRLFFRNAGLLAGAEAIARLKGLVLLPLLTHQLGTLGYGTWTQVSVLVAVLAPAIVLGTDSAVLRFLPATSQELRRGAFTAWALCMLLPAGVIAAGLALATGPISETFFGPAKDFGSFVALSGFALTVAVVLNVARTWFRIAGDAPMVAAMSVAQAATSLVAAVVVLLTQEGPYRLVAYSVAGDLAIALLLIIVIARRGGWGRPAMSAMPRLLRFGLPLFPASYAMLGLNAMDRLFLVQYETLAAVGVYSFGYSLGYLAAQLLINPVWTMFPGAIAELHNSGNADGVRKLFQRSVSAALILGIPAIAGSAVLGSQVVSALAPTAFARAAPVISIVMAGYLFHYLASYCEVRLYMLERQYVSTVSLVIAVTVNASLNLLLIPTFSLVGAALATTGAFAVQLAVAWVMAHRAGVAELPARLLGQVLLASAGMTLALLGLVRVAPEAWRGLLLLPAVAVGALVYLGALASMGGEGLATMRAALSPLLNRREGVRASVQQD